MLDSSGERHRTSCSSESTAFPWLPIDTADDPVAHREKIGQSLYLDNLCVARLVGETEIEKTPAAKEAMRKAWNRLRSKYVWDEAHPREWDDVRAEARRGGVLGSFGLPLRSLRGEELGTCCASAQIQGLSRFPGEPGVRPQFQLRGLPRSWQFLCDFAGG